jgi:hypothetical protein
VLLECLEEIVSMHFPDIFNAKTVNTECNRNRSPVVLPETGVDFALVIAVSLGSLFQEFWCNYSCLLEPIHSLLDVHIHITIMCYVTEFVEFDNVVRYFRQFQLDKFRAFHWSVEIKIFYVDGHELDVFCGDDTVEEDFDSEHVCCGRAVVAREVDSIASDCEANALRVILFWAKISHKASICYVLPSF